MIVVIARPVVVFFPTLRRPCVRMLVTVVGSLRRGVHMIPIVVVIVVVVTRATLRVLPFSSFVHRRDPPPRRWSFLKLTICNVQASGQLPDRGVAVYPSQWLT